MKLERATSLGARDRDIASVTSSHLIEFNDYSLVACECFHTSRTSSTGLSPLFTTLHTPAHDPSNTAKAPYNRERRLHHHRFTMIRPLTMAPQRQLRQETRSIFIGENTFDVDDRFFTQSPKLLQAFQTWCEASGTQLQSVRLRVKGFVALSTPSEHGSIQVDIAFNPTQVGNTVAVTKFCSNSCYHYDTFTGHADGCGHQIMAFAHKHENIFYSS